MKIDNSTCSICRSDYTDGSIKTDLDCKHAFHKTCVFAWVKPVLNNDAKESEYPCPLCRKPLTSNDMDKLVPLAERKTKALVNTGKYLVSGLLCAAAAGVCLAEAGRMLLSPNDGEEKNGQALQADGQVLQGMGAIIAGSVAGTGYSLKKAYDSCHEWVRLQQKTSS